jgi:hypothetical protein
MVDRSRGGGEGVLLWPRLMLEQEFAKGMLSTAFQLKQRGKGRGSGVRHNTLKRRRGGGLAARTRRAGGRHVELWRRGGLAADNGRAPVGQTGEVELGESSQWAVAGPLIWAGLMNSSFFDLIQIISTKPD